MDGGMRSGAEAPVSSGQAGHLFLGERSGRGGRLGLAQRTADGSSVRAGGSQGVSENPGRIFPTTPHLSHAQVRGDRGKGSPPREVKSCTPTPPTMGSRRDRETETPCCCDVGALLLVLVLGTGVLTLVLREPGKWRGRDLARNGKEGCHGQGARVLSGPPRTWGQVRPWSCLVPASDPVPGPVPCWPPCRPVLSE